MNWLFVIVLFFILRAIKRRYFSALSDVPGEFLASISRLGKVKEVLSGCTEKTQLELHRKYGKYKPAADKLTALILRLTINYSKVQLLE